jgi:hypothetical protein
MYHFTKPCYAVIVYSSPLFLHSPPVIACLLPRPTWRRKCSPVQNELCSSAEKPPLSFKFISARSARRVRVVTRAVVHVDRNPLAVEAAIMPLEQLPLLCMHSVSVLARWDVACMRCQQSACFTDPAVVAQLCVRLLHTQLRGMRLTYQGSRGVKHRSFMQLVDA